VGSARACLTWPDISKRNIAGRYQLVTSSLAELRLHTDVAIGTQQTLRAQSCPQRGLVRTSEDQDSAVPLVWIKRG
jgi:hypothetical protein